MGLLTRAEKDAIYIALEMRKTALMESFDPKQTELIQLTMALQDAILLDELRREYDGTERV